MRKNLLYITLILCSLSILFFSLSQTRTSDYSDFQFISTISVCMGYVIYSQRSILLDNTIGKIIIGVSLLEFFAALLISLTKLL